MKRILLIGDNDTTINKAAIDISELVNDSIFIIEATDNETLREDTEAFPGQYVMVVNSKLFNEKDALQVDEFIQLCETNNLVPAFISSDTLAMPNTMYITLEGHLEHSVHYLFNNDHKDYDVFLSICKNILLGEEDVDDNSLSSSEGR